LLPARIGIGGDSYRIYSKTEIYYAATCLCGFGRLPPTRQQLQRADPARAGPRRLVFASRSARPDELAGDLPASGADRPVHACRCPGTSERWSHAPHGQQPIAPPLRGGLAAPAPDTHSSLQGPDAFV